ncbi:hypothetical protein [Noviherbaspirillum sp.]|uniref:hypothetical protein n=1 Tax=Noviherbaspirillum sp. TaxID=1926288 RepID=UPI002B4809E3|nr:hypothetical protein [Noviherbaspirillum sp.]HJV80200.1 hypothetical protein [Noviherbaspirillum sp.]
MKKLLFMLLVAICGLAWRSPDIMHAIGLAGAAQTPVTVVTQPAPQPMSVDEFAERSKSDPQAYQKFINSFQMQDRSEVDKLMNLLAHGKYE